MKVACNYAGVWFLPYLDLSNRHDVIVIDFLQKKSPPSWNILLLSSLLRFEYSRNKNKTELIHGQFYVPKSLFSQKTLQFSPTTFSQLHIEVPGVLVIRLTRIKSSTTLLQKGRVWLNSDRLESVLITMAWWWRGKNDETVRVDRNDAGLKVNVTATRLF